MSLAWGCPVHLLKYLDRIDALAIIPHGWIDDSPPPTREALRAARAWAHVLPDGLKIYPVPGGGLQFECELFEVEVLPDGQAVILHQDVEDDA